MTTFRIVLAGLLVAATMAIHVASPPAAHACSCVSFDVEEFVSTNPAAFVGIIVDRQDTGRSGVLGPQVEYTFEVLEWVKGDLGERIPIESAANGAACGFEAGPGEAIGVVVQREGNRLTSNLCLTTSPSILRTAVAEPSDDPPQPVAYLVPGDFSHGSLAALAADGSIQGYLEGSEDSHTSASSVCPEGEVLVEARFGAITWRDLATLEPIDVLQVPGGWVSSVSCLSADGDDVWLVVNGDATAVVQHVEMGEIADELIVGSEAVVIGGTAYYSDGVQASVHELESGAQESIALEIAGDGGWVPLFGPDPSGSLLAIVEVAYSDEIGPTGLVRVLDARSLDEVARTGGAELSTGMWLSDRHLAVSEYHAGDPEGVRTLIYEVDETLELVHSIDGLELWQATVTDDAVMFAQQGELFALSIVDYSINRLGTIPGHALGQIIVLPRPVIVETLIEAGERVDAVPALFESFEVDGDRATGVDRNESDTASPAVSEADDSAAGRWIVIGAGVAIATLAALVLRLRITGSRGSSTDRSRSG